MQAASTEASERAAPIDVAPRRRRNSVVTRFATAVIGVAVLAVAVTSVVGLRSGSIASERDVDARLGAARGTRTVELRALLGDVVALARLLGESGLTSSAVVRFSDGFEELPLPEPEQRRRERRELEAYLAREVVPAVDAALDQPVGPADLLPETDEGVHLQHRFLVAADAEDPSLVLDVGDDDWGLAHREFHSSLRDVAAAAGADDLLLIDTNGVIVYGSAKSIDLGTSVLTGPTSGEAFAAAVRSLAAEAPVVTVTDLAVSSAALGQPVWHVLAPVRSIDGVLVGYVALRFSDEVLTSVASGREEWEADGLGTTGEVLLVGVDNRVRTDVRAHLEDPSAYRERAAAAGTWEPEELERVRGTGTTVLLARVDGVVAEAAASGIGRATTVDHLGREVRVEYGPLGPVAPSDPGWVVLAQVTVDEAVAPLDAYRRNLLVVAAVVVVIVSFLAAAWSSRLLRPIRDAGTRLRRAIDTSAFDPDPSTAATAVDAAPALAASPRSRVDEFRRLVDSFDAIDEGLEARRRATATADAERRRLLRTLLPAAVAERVEAGDRSVVDRVASASIVVVVLDGGAARPRRAQLDAVLEVIDAAAARLGAARVKMVGDSCFVAIGHDRPMFDHAPRAVALATAVVADLDRAGGGEGVRAAAGVATGRVDVGLGGASRLVYDVWGSTVTAAYAAARSAEPGTVRVTATTAALLPAEMVTEPLGDEADLRVVVPGWSDGSAADASAADESADDEARTVTP